MAIFSALRSDKRQLSEKILTGYFWPIPARCHITLTGLFMTEAVIYTMSAIPTSEYKLLFLLVRTTKWPSRNFSFRNCLLQYQLCS